MNIAGRVNMITGPSVLPSQLSAEVHWPADPFSPEGISTVDGVRAAEGSSSLASGAAYLARRPYNSKGARNGHTHRGPRIRPALANHPIRRVRLSSVAARHSEWGANSVWSTSSLKISCAAIIFPNTEK